MKRDWILVFLLWLLATIAAGLHPLTMLNSPAAEGNVRVPSELLIISAALNVLIIGLLLPTTASVDYFGFYSAGSSRFRPHL
jgi:hypothetical protein